MIGRAKRLSPPACPGDFPDPQVVVTGGAYVAFATNGGGANVQVRVSADLAGWEPRPDGLPELPAWAAPGRTWSPAVLERHGTFVLWYSLREPGKRRQAISTALASEPAGPYRDTTTGPAVYQVEMGGSIDPSPFVDRDGQPYLLWKSDGNAIRRRSALWIQPLSDDGRRVEGEPTLLLDRDRLWEYPLLEAPSMFEAGGRYWLLYSAGRFDTSGYRMGVAAADGPRGPFRRLSNHWRWVGSDRAGAGPGGQEPFTDAGGQLRLAYHAWEPGRVGYAAGGQRSLRIGRLQVTPGGLGLSP